MFSFCINVKYHNFIYYCIKVDYIKLLVFYIQLSLELLWLNIFSKVLNFYSKPEGCESHNTVQPLTSCCSCNTEQHAVEVCS